LTFFQSGVSIGWGQHGERRGTEGKLNAKRTGSNELRVTKSGASRLGAMGVGRVKECLKGRETTKAGDKSGLRKKRGKHKTEAISKKKKTGERREGHSPNQWVNPSGDGRAKIKVHKLKKPTMTPAKKNKTGTQKKGTKINRGRG